MGTNIYTRFYKDMLISVTKVGLQVNLLLDLLEKDIYIAPWQECREALLDHVRSFTKHSALLFLG